jgi:hypothetical protein
MASARARRRPGPRMKAASGKPDSCSRRARIRLVRRQSAVLLLVLLAVVAGLRLSAAAADTDAMRCAIACGHAAGMMKGAACCPMSNAPGSSPVLTTCPRGGAAVAPLASGYLLLAFAERLPAPDGSRPHDSAVSSAVSSAFLRAPEKVPLLLG